MHSKINPAHNSKFDYVRAIELSNLIERAYQQFDYHQARQKAQAIYPDQTPLLWEEKIGYQLIGSTAVNPTLGKDGIHELDHANNTHRTYYKILATFSYTGYWVGISDDVPFGFIVKQELEDQPDSPNLYVVFRGTRDEPEWFSNFQYAQVPFLTGTLATTLTSDWGYVSRGFNKMYTRPDQVEQGIIQTLFHQSRSSIGSLRESIINTLNDAHLCPPTSQVYVTGHSLGGALATLATLDIKKHTPFQTPILYTFASPRVGDPTFVRQFDDLQCYRIANSEDLVPTIPPPTSRLIGKEMINSVTPARRATLEFLLKVGRGVLDAALNTEYIYEHIGEPIYFTHQRDAISHNHNLFLTYREALFFEEESN